MPEQITLPEQLVFGLDIGTRSIVGTVGYLDGNMFHAIAQSVREHTSRAMIDGQIHDIIQVGETIKEVKKELEILIGRELSEVCIAAAGRVLRTVTTTVEVEFEEETVVNHENIYSLDLIGMEKAQEQLQKENQTDIRFYCVGYSVIKYYLNGNFIGNLEGHKASRIAEDIIATFLPDEVVDGLYAAVRQAGLEVSNLTLEPIAAINVAIPEKFRMLNIGLVDVGAGTSDICLTKDGSITAYGMIPMAGDELTEIIAKQYLVDFDMAEKIKTSVREQLLKSQKKADTKKPADESKTAKKETRCGAVITYEDILGIPHEVSPQEVCDLVDGALEEITAKVAEKIKELNGDKAVSAVFVVGGGGKFPGFTQKLAEKLGLVPERVALRGEEVLGQVEFYQKHIKKDSLLVTPIGICLNYYDKKNNFIFVNFNGERIKLYNNNHLTVVEAAMQANFPNDGLFPKRGRELNFTVNGKERIVRGSLGEAAVVKINGQNADLHTRINSNDKIEIVPSTAGMPAVFNVEDLPEFNNTIEVTVNGAKVVCPKFVQANKTLVSGFYEIHENDDIAVLNYYTLQQLLEFMDVILPMGTIVMINNKEGSLQEKIYDNFTIDWSLEKNQYAAQLEENQFGEEDAYGEEGIEEYKGGYAEELTGQYAGEYTKYNPKEHTFDYVKGNEEADIRMEKKLMAREENKKPEPSVPESSPAPEEKQLAVVVNEEHITLRGKKKYVFVDVFDYIDFDLSRPKGDIVTLINGENASYTQELKPNDQIKIYWEGQQDADV